MIRENFWEFLIVACNSSPLVVKFGNARDTTTYDLQMKSRLIEISRRDVGKMISVARDRPVKERLCYETNGDAVDSW